MPPRYINQNCPVCGKELVLADLLDNPDADPEEVWYDEWACPNCYDGGSVWIDFEPEYQEELERRLKEVSEGTVKTHPWEEIKNKFVGSKFDPTEFEEGAKEEEEVDGEKELKSKVRGILNFG